MKQSHFRNCNEAYFTPHIHKDSQYLSQDGDHYFYQPKMKVIVAILLILIGLGEKIDCCSF